MDSVIYFSEAMLLYILGYVRHSDTSSLSVGCPSARSRRFQIGHFTQDI